MVQGRLKSGHFRQVQKKLPGGSTAKRYKEGTPKQAHCSCGAKLHGIPRMSGNEARNAPKTTKRPERPYGGVLCSKCVRKHIVAQHR